MKKIIQKTPIYNLRKARKLTQRQLAEAINTTPQQICRLENGERKLAPEWIDRLSKVLNCTKAELLGEEPPEILTDEEQKLLEDFRALDPEKKANMRLILTALLDVKK